MHRAPSASPSLRRAVLLMTFSSFLVPAVGVLTAPILARALGATGRGELATALAPALLILPVATLGLPEALTYHLAKRPELTRWAIAWSSAISALLGLICLAGVIVSSGFLSAGDPQLARLIQLATALTVPAMIVGALRGAAIGRQMWTAVAVERCINVAIRLAVFGTFWWLGLLTVETAVLVSVLAPLVAALPYWTLFRSIPPQSTSDASGGRRVSLLLSYGCRVWLGAVASMLLARVGQMILTPLSDAEQTGLYVVAVTISDLPLVVALAIQGALFGVNSLSGNADQVTRTSRMTVLVGAVGCGLLAGTVPFWLEPLFGADFRAALAPTLMLVLSALICIPGLMASAGLGAAGRPGLRSWGLILALVVNVGAFVLLVPGMGVYGACWASIATNVVLTTYLVGVAARVLRVRARQFLVPGRSDVRSVVDEVGRLASRVPGLRRSRQV